MADGHTTARALAERIGAILDPAVRVRYLRHTITRLEPGAIADLLTVAMHGTEARDGAHGALLLALCLALAEEPELRDAVAQAAAAQGQHDTAALVSAQPAPARDVNESPRVPDFGAGRPLTLGERKSLARKRDRDLLARVLRDPHPDVIRILLDNPALTEDDVIRLCARRPVEPEVLFEVFRSTRWIVRYRVRRAIVTNPYAPEDVASQLAVHLDATDAREVASSLDLSVRVRDVCRRVAGLATLH